MREAYARRTVRLDRSCEEMHGTAAPECYDRNHLRPGKNVLPDGDEIFFVENPALGLWALRSQFASD